MTPVSSTRLLVIGLCGAQEEKVTYISHELDN